MFLKHYVGCSDRMIEHLNSNMHYQLFCDIVIPVDCPIVNYKIVSQIRCEVASKLKIQKVQQVFAQKWRPYMSELGSICMDATCYESDIRYPIDIKLLWKSLEWSYHLLKEHCACLSLPLTRTNNY